MGERVRPSECETEKEDREKGRKNDEEERADKVCEGLKREKLSARGCRCSNERNV